MDYQKIDELLLKIKSAYESIGAETELVVEEPASIAEVESIENIIERKLPLQIRDFFLQYSKKCKFSAWLPDGFELPSELDKIFSANFLISLEEFADAEKARNGWVENCFTKGTFIGIILNILSREHKVRILNVLQIINCVL